ncbi:MAG: ABC transporter substrate-binding protein [Bacteroidota bacterium]
MQQLTIALDWTPNINHIGFFIAQEKGFYKDRGLDVTLVDPSADNYQITPAKKIELGQADFALCPTESVISYRTKSKAFPMIGVAAILQEDLSAIAVLANAQINSPKDMDGKTYSSYKARYEDGIVREMIKNDGGKGELNIVYPDKLGIWNTLLQGEADSTWIFLNWEGVAAEGSNHSLSYFNLRDYDIPYSYSPLLVANEATLDAQENTYKAFLQATKEGYLYSQEAPEEAVTILQSMLPETDKDIDLARALEISSPHFGNQTNWGRLDERLVKRFLDWIYEKGLESQPLQVEELVTNRLLS